MDAHTAGIVSFGDALLTTGDLDPVYTAIHKANLDERTRMRLALAYWCFYHLGLAAQLAEQKSDAKFWALFREAVENKGVMGNGKKPFPRGAERRHFRGAQAMAAFQDLTVTKGYRTAAEAVEGLLGLRVKKAARHFNIDIPMTFSSVTSAVRSHVGFGPWIAFKIADMAERVLGFPVDFAGCHLGIYKDPRQGAAVALVELAGGDQLVPGDDFSVQEPWTYPITDEQLETTVAHYVKVFRNHKAPPTGNRRVNVQEVETIFCKYKSHLKGHYPVGKDTHEVGLGLAEGWGDLADQLNQGLDETRTRVERWRDKNGGWRHVA